MREAPLGGTNEQARGKLGHWTLALALVLELAEVVARPKIRVAIPLEFPDRAVSGGSAGIGGRSMARRNLSEPVPQFGDVLSHLSGGLMVLGEAHGHDPVGTLTTPSWMAMAAGAWSPGSRQQRSRSFCSPLMAAIASSTRPLSRSTAWSAPKSSPSTLASVPAAGSAAPPVSDSRSATWRSHHCRPRNSALSMMARPPGLPASMADVGGGPNGDLTWQLFGGVGYNFNKTIAGFVGYRYLAIDHSSGRFDYRFDQQGPMLGAAFRF